MSVNKKIGLVCSKDTYGRIHDTLVSLCESAFTSILDNEQRILLITESCAPHIHAEQIPAKIHHVETIMTHKEIVFNKLQDGDVLFVVLGGRGSYSRYQQFIDYARDKLGMQSVLVRTRTIATTDDMKTMPIEKATISKPIGSCGVLKFYDPRPKWINASLKASKQPESKLVCLQPVLRGDLPIRCFTCNGVMTPVPSVHGEKICCFQMRMVHINTMEMNIQAKTVKQNHHGDPKLRVCGAGGGVHPSSISAARIYRQMARAPE